MGEIVAALDFGTTFSGYCYSLREDYFRDPLQIFTNNWSDGSLMLTLKAPTVVLFSQDKKFHSFGYEAEKEYTDRAEHNEHHGWRYFRRFKMELYKSKKISRYLGIDDDQGNSMLALDVFAETIKYLKNHFMARIKERLINIEETDIHWVLTVPAIWTDAAKQFMNNAAIRAGIHEQQLYLAYEPEAAAIYCSQVKINTRRENGDATVFESLGPGTRFMVLDLGGGTVDITVHEVRVDKTLDTLLPPSGGPWGGTLVDAHFNGLLENMFSRAVMRTFAKDYKIDKLDLDRLVEVKKRQVKQTRDKDVLKLPVALFDTYKELKQITFEDSLKTKGISKAVAIKRDKLSIANIHFVKLFDACKENIITHIHSILREPESEHVKTLLMVGGFSESEIIRKAVTDAFPKHQGYNVIIAEEGGAAILKGAVMYGHDYNWIRSRRMQYAYGISTAVPFDKRKHNAINKVNSYGNMEKCENIFKPFVKRGEAVDTDQSITHSFNPPDMQIQADIEFYRASSDNVEYVTDKGCKRIGVLKLELTGKRTVIDVSMWFGGTQMKVSASERGTTTCVKSQFEFLK